MPASPRRTLSVCTHRKGVAALGWVKMVIGSGGAADGPGGSGEVLADGHAADVPVPAEEADAEPGGVQALTGLPQLPQPRAERSRGLLQPRQPLLARALLGGKLLGLPHALKD